jgi:nucleoid-associated protein YgaU
MILPEGLTPREVYTVPNDARLGLIVGVAVVIAVSVVFFRRDSAATQAAGMETAAALPQALPRDTDAASRLPSDDRNAGGADESKKGLRYVVQEGDTLFSLAQRYYGDREKVNEIYRVNREILKNSDQLTPGTVLVLPDLKSGGDQQTTSPQF